MTLRFNYGRDVVVLPLRPLLARVEQATKRDLRLLLLLAADPRACADYEGEADRLATEAGVSRAELDRALSFWQGAGVIDAVGSEAEEVPVPPSGPAKRPRQLNAQPGDPDNTEKSVRTARRLEHETTLPNYTTEQMTALLETRAEAKALIDAAQQTFGKLFSTMEVNYVLGMLDYLSLESEYILILLAWCAGHGKKSMRYAEKMAISLCDEGIREPDALNAYLRRREETESAMGRIRTLFGAADRTLTPKESAALRRWIEDFGYNTEIVSRAYEVTVNAISKPSIPYADSVLARWHAEGLVSLEQIDANLAARAKSGKDEVNSSFDTDDFFEAALRKSYS